MGFQCYLNQKHVYSFSLLDTEWYALKENYKEIGLKISCCGTDCVPKENQLGTRFFAHKKLEDCPYSNIKDSRELQYLKYIISRVLVKLGWHVEHNFRGVTPDGSDWTADIYAEKNGTRFIFEILWNEGRVSSALDKYQKYNASGIRSAWFMRIVPSVGFPYETYTAMTAIKVPSFPFKYDRKDKQFYITNLNLFDSEFNVRKFETFEICQFTEKLFMGQVHTLGNLKTKYEMSLKLSTQTCWNCYCETSFAHKASFMLKTKEGSIKLLQVDVISLPPTILSLINAPDFLELNTLGELIVRPDNSSQNTLVSNGCYQCGAIQANFYNISQFSKKNSFDSTPIEVVMPLGFPVDNQVFIFGK